MTTATARRQKIVDPEAIADVMRIFMQPGQVVELRALEANVANEWKPQIYFGYFADMTKFVEAAQSIKSANGIYFTPNLIKPELLPRSANRIRIAKSGDTTSDHDVLRRRWLLIDCDAQRVAGISASDAQHEAAVEAAQQVRDYLTGEGWPDPVLGDSGNGGHANYRIDLPADDGGLVERCLKALADKFNKDAIKIDEKVFNPARIWKLYGTLAAKGDDVPGHPHRMSKILKAPEVVEVVSVELLEALAAKAPKPKAAANPSSNGKRYNGATFDLPAWIARYCPDARPPKSENGETVWVLPTCPFNTTHSRGEAFIIQRADGYGAGCQHNGCTWTWKDLRALKEPGCYDRAPSRPEYDEPDFIPPSANGHGEHDAAPPVAAAKPADKPLEFQRITSAELDAGVYELEFLIDNMLVAGQPCIIAGSKKSLKTSLIIDMAISLAVGRFFLGLLKVARACRVMVMSGESGLATIQETARRIAEAAGHKLADLANLFWSTDLPRIGNAEHLDALRRFLTENEIEVLFLDPAYLCMPGGDAGNLFIQGELLRGISELCNQLGVTLVLAHHTKRGVIDPFQPPELEDIAWAGFQEWARQWLLVGRRERYEPGTGEHKLWLNVGGSAGHSALWAVDVSEGVRTAGETRRWEVTVMPADEARSDAEKRRDEVKTNKQHEQDAQDRVALIKALRQHREGGTKTDLKAWSGLNTSRRDRALATLKDSGAIVDCELSKSNHKTPHPGYRLSDAELANADKLAALEQLPHVNVVLDDHENGGF